MATFEFTSPEGKTFELEGPEGSTKEQAFQKFQEIRPELFSAKKEKKEKPGFVERFGETFQPVKAITEEGIIPQLGQYAKRKLTGEPAPVIESFNRWKGHYTAYKDIDTAIHASPTAYNNYLKGVLEPQDLMTAIKSRRPAEAQEPFGAKTRPQTYTSALGSGLNLLGKEPEPTTIFGAIPKVAAGAVAKPLQALGYTPVGQSLLYQGVPFTGLAPRAGYAAEKTSEQRKR